MTVPKNHGTVARSLGTGPKSLGTVARSLGTGPKSLGTVQKSLGGTRDSGSRVPTTKKKKSVCSNTKKEMVLGQCEVSQR